MSSRSTHPLNKSILSDLSKLSLSINEGLLGIGVNNNVFEALNKTKSDIIARIASQESEGGDHMNQIVELIN